MRIKLILVLLLLSLSISSQLVYATINPGWPFNRIVAVVNNEVITQDQLNQQVLIVKGQMQSSNTPLPDEHTLEEQVLQQLIDRQLQLQIAQRAGIQVMPSDIDNAINNIAQGNNITTNQLYAAVMLQGLSVRDFRDEVRKEVIVQQVEKQMVGSRIKITDEETNEAMQAVLAQMQASQGQYHVGDIVFNLPVNPTAAQQSQVEQAAQNIVNQLRSGANFNRIVNALPAKVATYTDLGNRSLADLPDQFANALQSMQIGDVSDPILTGNGYHVIKLFSERSRQTISTQNVVQSKVQIIVLHLQPGISDQMIQARLLGFVQEIDKGYTSFGLLAQKYSQDMPSKLQGGNLGWIEPGQLPAAVDQVIAELPAGGISQPIATPDGWYLVHVLAKRNMIKASPNVVQQVQDLLFHRKFAQQLQAWLANLRSQAYIKILVPEYQDLNTQSNYE